MALLFLTGRTLHYRPGPIGSLLHRSSTILTPIRRASTTSRKQVTVVNDDGRVRWGELTATEKIARTTQKTFHFGIIVTGMVMTVGAGYFLYKEVFASDSKTRHFNKAVDEVCADPRAQELLGPGNKIRAFGEPTSNKWARARPIASSVQKDRSGRDHLLMHFNVEGPKGAGVVRVHMIRDPDTMQYEYKYLLLDVKGHPKLYLRNTDETLKKKKKKQGLRLFGVEWR